MFCDSSPVLLLANFCDLINMSYFGTVMGLLQFLHSLTVCLLTTCQVRSRNYGVKSTLKRLFLFRTLEHLEMPLSIASGILLVKVKRLALTISGRPLIKMTSKSHRNLSSYTFGLIRYNMLIMYIKMLIMSYTSWHRFLYWL